MTKSSDYAVILANFRPTAYHNNEYNMQKFHTEEVLRAVWQITLLEWCHFFISKEKLRDFPPVATDKWLKRIDRSLPFMVGNLRCSSTPEQCISYRAATFKSTESGYVQVYKARYS